MPRKRHKPEEIVAKLRQVDVLTSQGQSVADAIRSIGVTRGDVLPLAPGVRRAEERPGEAAEGSRDGEHPASQRGVRPDAGQADPAGGGPGKLLSPARRRACIEHVRELCCLRAPRLCGARPASLDAAQDPAGPRR